MTVDLERAKGGDERAFASLVEPFRRELQLHCYRLLGSVQDAEDLVQETLFAAWRGLNGFEERASLRSWLYRIATNRSLNAIRERGRRPATENTMRPSRTRRAVEPSWLEPYADSALPDPAPGPEARYEQREAIQLSFIVALQQLPAKQRAALVLRDVLGFHTDEAASILETTPQSVKAALGAHLERQQGRRDHLLRRPRAARPLRSSRTHLAGKDEFDMKWKPPFRGDSGTQCHALRVAASDSCRGLGRRRWDAGHEN
jgi:RNA polymerase sigma-70 factor (ECF subfamily)